MLQGKCIDYCSSSSVISYLAAAQVMSTCDFGKANQCSGGLVCERFTSCIKLFCENEKGVVVETCSGLCQPTQRLMLSAAFSDSADKVSWSQHIGYPHSIQDRSFLGSA
jgi:hypothetical protein